MSRCGLHDSNGWVDRNRRIEGDTLQGSKLDRSCKRFAGYIYRLNRSRRIPREVDVITG